MSRITSRGRKWEIQNSIWIIWSFLYVFNFIGFLYIGFKTKTGKWKLIGFVLLVICSVIPIGFTDFFNNGYMVSSISFITYFVGIALSFIYRKEYLIKLDVILNNAKDSNELLRNKIESKYLNKYSKTDTISNKKESENTYKNIPKNNTDKININSCSEEELLNLPGINIALAKKTMEYRNTNNGFNSFEQFIDKMEIKPHFAIQLKDLIEVNKLEYKKDITVNKGRKLDV